MHHTVTRLGDQRLGAECKHRFGVSEWYFILQLGSEFSPTRSPLTAIQARSSESRTRTFPAFDVASSPSTSR